ncbi:GPW/gp25 family protein [Streptomyces sp. NPDC006372]|uniref:GPW/gp25 family protein n=1 Tax=Streptomyces sp. NPDC006372 TaxID=3155599 RepID=UPI0033A205CC
MTTPARPPALRFPPVLDPADGTLAREADEAAHVDQLMRQVLLTDPGERVNRPDFGCGLRRMLFAPNDPAAAALVRVVVVEALERWLGQLVRVDDVEVRTGGDRVEVTVSYLLRARGERRFLNVEVGA